MRFALVIYDEKQRCFMPAYSSDLPSGWAVPGRGKNKQHLIVPRADFARTSYKEVLEILKDWGYQDYQIVRNNFFWTHDLKAEHPRGIVVICNDRDLEKHPIIPESVYPADWNVVLRHAHAAWADTFRETPKAVGLVVRQGKGRFLPMLFQLRETGMPDSMRPRHEYTYLERTEYPLATLALAQQQFARMSYKPGRIIGVENLPVGNFEEADIRIYLGTSRFDYKPGIRIFERDIFAVELTEAANRAERRPVFA